MYSQDETVLVILKFYQQVILHPYLPSSALITPPPTGWPTISEPTQTKTPTVLSLLRHLPYLHSENNSDRICLQYETIAIDYSSGSRTGGSTSFAEDVYPLPDHCVYLTRSVDREGIALILDTNEGIITHMGSGSRLQIPYEEYDALPFEEQWKVYEKIPVKEFFEKWTKRYEMLVWMLVPNPIGVPTSGSFITRASLPVEEDALLEKSDWQPWEYGPLEGESEAHSGQRKHAADVYNTYLNYGWPDRFDKEACRAALLELEMKKDKDERAKMDELFPDPPGMFDSDED
ncbi:hypothetical protein DL95DRAFT_396846 [Leptodontidium sp. 2 PMI_412]|nr:hypothetical protein BKA61DRAFT_618917 [Leptodontidium sp. MPI-SDFR-AT-0119]KAH9206555.1 hypothetical protein DL95DRAFT_396846 [Leptodontidium sp. 2 PMI_412]